MAIQTRSLAAVEHDYFFSQLAGDGLTVPANTPLTEVKRHFYKRAIGAGAANKVRTSELEREWLQSSTGLTSQNLDELWRKFVISYGIATANKTTNQIKYEFYIKNTI